MKLYTWHRYSEDRRYSSFTICERHIQIVTAKDHSGYGTAGGHGPCQLCIDERPGAKRDTVTSSRL